MAKITLVKDDEGDWEAIYFNGELVDEGHSLSYSYVVIPALLGKTVESFEEFWTTAFEDFGGRAPEHLNQFKDEDLTPG